MSRTYHHESRRWRGSDEEDARPTRYALDYRIVVEKYRAIAGAEAWKFENPGNLDKGCHELIADIIAVLCNLGFRSSGFRSQQIQWTSGSWENWHLVADGEAPRVLFQVKAYKNGNVHLRFLPDAIKALNVEAGRLLGWLHSAEEVVTELGYTKDEAKRFYSSTRLIAPSNIRLLEGAL